MITSAYDVRTDRSADRLISTLRSALGDSFAVERELARGAMGRVFVAWERPLARWVALKVLPTDLAIGISIARFRREINLAASLQHAYIVPVLHAGDVDGLPYFTMPLVEGETLRDHLARRGALELERGVRLLREIASALECAHRRRIVHRDIKPGNVLLSHDSAMVTDFGVAKALDACADQPADTTHGLALGTPAYMSPEQAVSSAVIDERSDLYSFGVLAYEIFAGRPPFRDRPARALVAAHVTEPPPSLRRIRSSLPPALSKLIMTCLEKNPDDRPRSACEVVASLDRVVWRRHATARAARWWAR